MSKYLFTSRSVTEGHPDKICDQISDAILDALLEQDPMSRVACETVTTTGVVMCMGEITTKAIIDIPQIVRDTVVGIGYDRAKYVVLTDKALFVLTTTDSRLILQQKDNALGWEKSLKTHLRQVQAIRVSCLVRLRRNTRTYANAYITCSQACT